MSRVNWATVCEVAGLGSVVIGCFLLAPFVGFIAAGVSLLIFGVALGRGRNN